MTVEIERSGSDELFALLQKVLPQHLLSRGMHALARSRQPAVRNLVLRTVLRSYPQIDMHEALQPDPFRYESFNAFFTRELRPGARPIATDAHALVSPVDGTVSQLGRTNAGALVQAKGMHYTCEGLLADVPCAASYTDLSSQCLTPSAYARLFQELARRPPEMVFLMKDTIGPRPRPEDGYRGLGTYHGFEVFQRIDLAPPTGPPFTETQ